MLSFRPSIRGAKDRYEFPLCSLLLSQDIDNSQSAWRSLMIYFGGLTFSPQDPENYLRIPNKIAAKRIAEAVLKKYGLRDSPRRTSSRLTKTRRRDLLTRNLRNEKPRRDLLTRNLRNDKSKGTY